jgi:ATP-dependent Clp endopeptidase proteolytic subunit ClpP
MNEILMYGEIGLGGITDTELISQLYQSNGQETKVRLNSPGGDVFQGFAIYNAIKEHGQCDMYIDGLAASMASIIMLAGRKIYASKNAMIMIHNPSIGGYQGDSKKLKSISQLLDKVKQLAIESYSERTGIDVEELATMLDSETWLTAQEALEKGFIDEITDEVLETESTITQKAKTPKMVFMNYKKKGENAPKSLTVILGIPSNSNPESILKAISSLKNRNVSLEAENKRIKTQIKQEQKEEAKKITALAIEKGVINKNLERIQLMAFDTDFKKTKEDLLNAISEVNGSSVQMQNHKLIREIVLGSKTTIDEIKTSKPKSEWTLQDYRKNAPKELENDRTLYNKLIKEEYNQ